MRLIKADQKRKEIGGKLGSLLKLENDPSTLGYAILGRAEKNEQKEVYRDYLKAGCMNGCIRERVLGYRNKTVARKPIWSSLQETFHVGQAVHRMLQNDHDYFGSALVGFWKCRACGSKFFGRKQKKDCPKCGAKHTVFEYSECWLEIKEPGCRFVGVVDLILTYNRGIYHVGELKTESGKSWKERTTPDIEHVIQTLCYMKYSQKAKPLTDYVTLNKDIGFLIYASKETQQTCPYKVFIIRPKKYLVDLINHSMDQFCRCWQDENLLPPAHVECLNNGKWVTSSKSKECPVKDECFSHEAGPQGNLD